MSQTGFSDRFVGAETVLWLDAHMVPRLAADQARVLFDQATAGLVATLINTLLVCAVQSRVVSIRAVVAWGTFMVAVTAARAGLVIWQRRARPADAEMRRWGQWFVAGTVLAAGGWGASAIVLFPEESPTHQVFLAFVIGGMAAGSVPVLASMRVAVLGFLLPTLLPITIRFFLAGHEVGIAMGLMTLLFTLMLVITASKSHDTIVDSMSLQHRNEGLLHRVEKHAESTLRLNRSLESEIRVRKEKEQQLVTAIDAAQAARQDAEEANRIKSIFLATMSHEIRTPMNGVLGMAELLLGTELTGRQRHFAETIHRSGGQLLAIINDVLDFSKGEAGKLHLETLAFDPRETVHDVVTLLAESARRKGLLLHCELSESAPVILYGDAGRLSQVLTNLVGNAIKFTTEGEVIVRLLTEESEVERVWLRFAVADTGIGIAAEKQENIFEVFSQADTSTTRQYGGTGLGLAICKQLVTLMGGEITVTSQLGVGATFSCRIPFSSVGDGLSPARRAAHTLALASSEPFAGGRVLVVEDNAINQEVAVAMLQELRLQVDVAANGREAIARFAEDSFDVILMDCQMPEMDGYQATAAIRDREQQRNAPPTPIVALTADASASDRADCLAAGMNDYLSKPFTAEQIRAVLLCWIPVPEQTPRRRPDDLVNSDEPPPATALQQGMDAVDQAALEVLRRMERNGSPGLIQRLISIYCEDTPRRLAALREAIAVADAEALRQGGHALKSSSANLGMNCLASLCHEIEGMGRAAAFAGAADKLAEMEAEYHRAVAAFHAELAPPAP